METQDQAQKVMTELYRDIQKRAEASPLGLCPLDLTLNFVRACHAQSCGKCVPCRIGLGRLEAMLETILDGECEETILDELSETAQTIADTADCAIGYEAAQRVLQGLEGFREDYREHIRNGKCPQIV